MDIPVLKVIIAKIVSEVTPEDLEVYEIEADEIIRDALRERRAEAVDGDVQPRFSFHDLENVASTIADYVKIVVATVQSLKTLGIIGSKPSISAESLTTLQTRWEDELKRAGLGEKEATLISLRFSRDLLNAAAGKSI